MQDSKARTIAYWITTVLAALPMLGSGSAKLMHAEQIVGNMKHLGYPEYIVNILGPWMVLGGIALLLPGFARVKEWAYAGIVFAMSGAVLSHLFAGDAFGQLMPPLVIMGLALASYFLRPPSRRLPSA